MISAAHAARCDGYAAAKDSPWCTAAPNTAAAGETRCTERSVHRCSVCDGVRRECRALRSRCGAAVGTTSAARRTLAQRAPRSPGTEAHACAACGARAAHRGGLLVRAVGGLPFIGDALRRARPAPAVASAPRGRYDRLHGPRRDRSRTAARASHRARREHRSRRRRRRSDGASDPRDRGAPNCIETARADRFVTRRYTHDGRHRPPARR